MPGCPGPRKALDFRVLKHFAHPDDWRAAWLADERGTLFRDAPLRTALCYPNPYPVAMSSLGYQVIYRMFNSRPFICAERVVLPEEPGHWRRKGWEPVSIESGRRLSDFDVLAFSVTFDLDVTGVFELLDLAGIPLLRSERDEQHHPLVLLGGPITASNVLPLGPFVDLAVIGDGEVAAEQLLNVLDDASSYGELKQRAADIDGVWVPEIHGDAVPPTQKVTTSHLPAVAQITTPHAELSDMFLVEASRGCPRHCKFCLVRSNESPMRESELKAVLDAVPDDAPRVGFVGAAVSEWPGIKSALRAVIDRGKGVGISSLRADRLDEEFVGLLAEGGYRTMTVASDAPSARMRARLAKGLRTEHLVRAAELGKAAGMKKLKLYVIVGLPGETDDDIAELVSFSGELSKILPLVLGVSPLVPKLHTPLGDAPFAGIKQIDATLRRLRHELGGVADLRATSGRWAWVEYRMSQGGQDAGLAAMRAWRAGGKFADWKRELSEAEERGGLQAAQRAGLWPAAGMR